MMSVRVRPDSPNIVGEPAGVGVRLITDEAEFDSQSDNQVGEDMGSNPIRSSRGTLV